MNTLSPALESILTEHKATGKPLSVIMAGHNGSGKSTLWHESLAPKLRIPLINADRLMLSILPEAGYDGHLVTWAATLRDRDKSWMSVAQQGVQSFVSYAMAAQVPFGMETVFSHWQKKPDGSFASKIDLIHDLQNAGYFVLLMFVGLSNVELSIARVMTRVLDGGHDVAEEKLRERFPRTQYAVGQAATIADAFISADNSLSQKRAFTVCRVQMRNEEKFDLRNGADRTPRAITEWLDIVSPRKTVASKV